MQETFAKNIQFSKLIKANGKLKEFNFLKINVQQESVFTVDVVDERDSRVFFNIKKVDNSWRIIELPLPKWILENESSISEIIEEEIKQQ
jgi:hypothetical protein